MKKQAFLLSLFALTVLPVTAQLSPKSYLSLSIGPSFPLGQYAAFNDIKTDGYATSGSVLVLDWAKYYSNFGMTVTMSFGNHGLNQNALNAEFIKSGQNVVYTDSSKWMSSCLMIGPAYAISMDRIT